MAFGYVFVTLSAEEKIQRRYLLDLYGNVAQFSALGVLILIQLYLFICWIGGKYFNDSAEPPKSPHGRVGKAKGSFFRTARQNWRKLCWWAGEPLVPGWGTRGEWIGALAWTFWMLFLCFHRTGNDYLHLTKRFGMVGSANLPLHYMLAMKSPYSPVQLLTRLSHEELKASHQILGRILCFLFSLHAVFYFNFFIQSGLLSKRLKEWDVVFGIITFAMFATLSTTALGFLRRWNYRTFYTTHVALAVLVLESLFFHVSHVRIYILEIVIIIIGQQIFRNYSLRTYSGTISIIPGTNLVQIRIPLVSIGREKKWKAGQHVYLSRPTGTSSSFGIYENFVKAQRINPFTIASLPAKDKQLLLIARTLGGNTKHLANLARSLAAQTEAGEPGPSIPLTIEGPYGASARLPDFGTYDQVLLVAGGVGATFIVPVYRDMVEFSDVGTGSRLAPRVRFIWAVRKLAETRWAFTSSEEPENEDDGEIPAVEVFLTRNSGDSRAPLGPDVGVTGEDIELAEVESLLRADEEMEKPRAGMTVKLGRPNLAHIAEEMFAGSTGKVAVLVCGPERMTEDMREIVRRWVGQGKDVYYHSETFGW